MGCTCIMVNVTERVRLPVAENAAIFACFSYPDRDPLANVLLFRITPLKSANGYWERHTTPVSNACSSYTISSFPSINDPSLPGRLYERCPSGYRRICFPCHPYRTKGRNRSRDLMSYSLFRRSVARPNSMKPNGGSNRRLCCVGLFPTALQRRRRYVMDSGFPSLNIIP